jgi:hypothetical protein
MRPQKSTVLVVLLTFLLAAFALAMGQGTTSTTQTDQKKNAESCCAEGAKCCAEGASCKHEGESCCKEGAECCKEGAECCKKDGDKDHAGCCGESCEMKDGKHDAKMKHDPKKPGECCKIKTKDSKDAKPKTKA